MTAAPDILTERELRLTSVGIDIGSATSHLVFTDLTLEKRGSRFVTTGYTTRYASPVLLTPYVDGSRLDGAALAAFFRAQHAVAGIGVDEVDTGALILTGAALLRENARAVAEAVGHAAGTFVAVSAGDALEATMSAHGSGAVALSRRTAGPVLTVDVGGGTTKLAVCRAGRVDAVAALDVGARLVAVDPAGVVVRLEEAGRAAAAALGRPLRSGAPASGADLAALADHFAGEVLRAAGLAGDGARSPLLRGPALPPGPRPEAVVFAGGVAEYVHGRQTEDFGDLGPLLAARLRDGVARAGVRVADQGRGIRATVLGAGRHTAQVSGSTVYVSDPSVLPLREVPVVAPHVDFGALTVAGATRALAAGLDRRGVDGGSLALALDWDGTASYDRLHALASALDAVLAPRLRDGAAAVLVSGEDVAGLLGAHLREEVGAAYPVVAVDCVDLADFDFVDIGRPLPGTRAMPIVIRSLVFPEAAPR